MKKPELVQRLAELAGLSSEQAASAVDALFATDGGIIAGETAAGKPVEIGEFGSFLPPLRIVAGARGRRPPPDDEEGPPPAPVFRPGKGWKDAGPRLRGGRKPPKGTGSTGPRRGFTGSHGPKRDEP